jgi:hypothetical protein
MGGGQSVNIVAIQATRGQEPGMPEGHRTPLAPEPWQFLEYR